MKVFFVVELSSTDTALIRYHFVCSCKMSTGKEKKKSMDNWLDEDLDQNSDLYEALEGEPEESDVSRDDFDY